MAENSTDLPTEHTAPAQEPRQEVPKVVRDYGTLIMVVNVIGMGLAVLGLLSGGLTSGAFLFLIALFFYRLGDGLKKGERMAVYCISILGGLAVIYAFVVIPGFGGVRYLVVGLVAVFCAPPLISAFRHWNAFK